MPSIATKSGFTKKHSKIPGSVLVLVVGFINNPTASLNQLSQIAQQLGMVFTRSALSQRFNWVTVEFLRLLFEEALQQWQGREGVSLKLFQPFSGV